MSSGRAGLAAGALCFGIAAGGPRAATADPALHEDTRSPLEAVDHGDRCWAAGDRGCAREQWRAAARSEDPAAAALGELRLLWVGGNLGLAVHGPRADAALARCDPARPWCQLAAADRILTARQLGLPAPGNAQAHAEAALRAEPAAATARLVWAGKAPVLALDDHDGGGLSAVLRAGEGRWPTPGTWVAGLLVAGGSGQGLVLGARLDHPDLGLQGHQLQLQVAGTTRGGGGVQAAYRGAGPRAGLGEISLQRSILDVYEPGGRRRSIVADGGSAATGIVWRARPVPLSLELRAEAQADRVGRSSWWGTGPGVVSWWRPLPALSLGAAAHQRLGAVRQTRTSLELRRSPSRGLATRLLLDASLAEQGTPLWWRPAAGGGQVLRQGGLGRFRGPLLGAAVAEWRQPVVGPLQLLAFGEAAVIDGVHGGLGGGLRLDLPPRPGNLVRFDLGWGDGGLGISAGLGHAF